MGCTPNSLPDFCYKYEIVISGSFFCCSLFCLAMIFIFVQIEYYVSAGIFGFSSILCALIGIGLIIEANMTYAKMKIQRLEERARLAHIANMHREHFQALARLAAMNREHLENSIDEGYVDCPSDESVHGGDNGHREIPNNN